MTNKRKLEIFETCMKMEEHQELIFPLSHFTFTYEIKSGTENNIDDTSLSIFPILGNSDFLRSVLVDELGYKDVKKTLYSSEIRGRITFVGNDE